MPAKLAVGFGWEPPGRTTALRMSAAFTLTPRASFETQRSVPPPLPCSVSGRTSTSDRVRQSAGGVSPASRPRHRENHIRRVLACHISITATQRWPLKFSDPSRYSSGSAYRPVLELGSVSVLQWLFRTVTNVGSSATLHEEAQLMSRGGVPVGRSQGLKL